MRYIYLIYQKENLNNMSNETKSLKGFYCVILALILTSVALNVYLLSRQAKVETTIETKTDTVWKDTTIYQPTATDSTNEVRIVYIKMPTCEPSDTIHDSIMVQVPIMQKRYDDSLYTAWVSGYEPALDSIRLYQPTITETITITNTITKKAPRLTVGIQAGAGVGAFSRQPDIYIGVGGQLNLWRK